MESELTNVNEQVKALLAEALQLEPELVTPDLTFGDIPQWDSMGHMEVMMRLEEYFGVEINPDTIASLISLPLICEYINNMDG
jgi:acyl carrier protein